MGSLQAKPAPDVCQEPPGPPPEELFVDDWLYHDFVVSPNLVAEIIGSTITLCRLTLPRSQEAMSALTALHMAPMQRRVCPI
jgi:hypothetical protein